MEEQQLSKEEQIGFHKGALHTLSNERNELARMISIVDQLMQAHLSSLKELGVDLSAGEKQQEKKEKKPIDDILK